MHSIIYCIYVIYMLLGVSRCACKTLHIYPAASQSTEAKETRAQSHRTLFIVCPSISVLCYMLLHGDGGGDIRECERALYEEFMCMHNSRFSIASRDIADACAFGAFVALCVRVLLCICAY